MDLSLPALGRAEAKRIGAKRYIGVYPCQKGHGYLRRTSSGDCIECAKIRKKNTGRPETKRRSKQRRNWRAKGMIELPTRPMPPTCENCNRPENAGKALAADHDHMTGLFRGWLCFRCNRSIGGLGDTVDGLTSAVAYLQRHYGT